MTDTLLPESDLPVLVVPAAANIPPGAITAAEWDALKGRVTAVEGLGLVDLRDVDATGLADGLALIYDATLFGGQGGWKPGAVKGSIRRIGNAGTTDNAYDVDYISLRGGMQFVATATPGTIFIENVFGGTGSSSTVARADHTHAQPLGVPFEIAAGGDLSSGTVTLASGNVTGLSSDRSYLLTATLRFDVRGAGTGAGFGTARIILDGTTSARPKARVVSGVDREITWEHEGIVVSGVSSVAVSATFQHDGASDPINVGAGRLVVTRRPYR